MSLDLLLDAAEIYAVSNLLLYGLKAFGFCIGYSHEKTTKDEILYVVLPTPFDWYYFAKFAPGKVYRVWQKL